MPVPWLRGCRQLSRSGRVSMATPIITLTTDFGTRDPWVGIMKGVILGICPEARLVDLTHEIAPQDVLEAAMALESATRFFPEGTVHLAVVDPGVGGSRHPVAARAGGQLFVGPDNGLFTFALERADGERVVDRLEAPEYRLAPADRFGNLVTSVTEEDMAALGGPTTVEVGGRMVGAPRDSYAETGATEPGAIMGSAG